MFSSVTSKCLSSNRVMRVIYKKINIVLLKNKFTLISEYLNSPKNKKKYAMFK